jgi:hypothetical protein
VNILSPHTTRMTCWLMPRPGKPAPRLPIRPAESAFQITIRPAEVHCGSRFVGSEMHSDETFFPTPHRGLFVSHSTFLAVQGRTTTLTPARKQTFRPMGRLGLVTRPGDTATVNWWSISWVRMPPMKTHIHTLLLSPSSRALFRADTSQS